MSFLFLFASLGVINGFLLSIYLLIKSANSILPKYFGLLLLALVIRIGKSVFFYFNREVDLLILQIGLSACVFIGPFFYLFFKSLQKGDTSMRRNDAMMLALLFLVIIVVGIIYPYRVYPQIWNGYIIYFIYTIWVLFIFLGLYHVVNIVKSELKDGIKPKKQLWYIIAIAMSVVFITLTYQLALFVKITYIWGALLFSFSFYYLLGRVILNKHALIPKLATQKLENGKQLLAKVDQIMANEKPFRSQGLKLDDLAVKSGMSKHLLSKVLNEVYLDGFSHYVKEYRVNEAKSLIVERKDLSLEGIGYEAGFNSKSAFFDAFKKVANCTPAEYKKAN